MPVPRFRRFPSFARLDERGGVAVMAACAFPVLALLAGGAVDMQQMGGRRARLQDALDAAVLAGARASSGHEAAAQATFAANYGAGAPAPDFDWEGGRLTSGAVTVPVPTTFLTMIGIASLPARAEAAALATRQPPYCVLLLEPAANSLVVDSNSLLDASACGVQVNSAHATQAVLVKSNATIKAQPLCSNGGVVKNSNGRILPQAPEDCGAVPNPLSRMPEPSVPGTCTDVTVGPNGRRSIPGDACYRNITVSANASLTLGSGVTRITGHVDIRSNSSFSADSATLFFSGANARLTVNSNSGFTLTAPMAGPTAGMAMFQNHDPSQSSAAAYALDSNVAGSIEGVVYLPNAELVVNSNVTSNAHWTLFIAKTLTLDSNAVVRVNADYSAGPPVPEVFRSVRLEE